MQYSYNLVQHNCSTTDVYSLACDHHVYILEGLAGYQHAYTVNCVDVNTRKADVLSVITGLTDPSLIVQL